MDAAALTRATLFLWRGSLLPLGRKAAPTWHMSTPSTGAATQPSASKLARHRVGMPLPEP
ncbi:hypothetical protein C1886_12430 [Pseudomonas sp. FW300-N1A1]|nr:hypothetical protein C1886_12430 [Pseudomonas sp. FW300-N1A1]